MARTGTSPETRMLAITRYLSGEPMDRLIEDYGVSKSSIYRWAREWEEKSGKSAQVMRNQMVTAKQYYNLDQKTQKLEQMVTFLRVIHCTAGDSLEAKLAEVERMYYESDFSVHVMCEALDVPRGTFYNHIKRNKRNNSSHELWREELRCQILKIYDDSNQIYGSRKILAELQAQGVKTSIRMVQQLMREMGIRSITQGAKKQYLDENRKCQNIIKRNFDVAAPNMVWVSDVTYITVNGEGYFICAIIDLYARKAIS